ncbi:MAG: sulfoxide reductase heme-binding subunit YedZ [Proteobacteria bacterium ST_bin12]|nr:MAG: sulfoxide reductase heme-binding subunit YedZ [Proteobacteria bacterium ST_bin12]
MKKQHIVFVKAAIWIFALLPIARLIWLGVNDNLGANPIEFIEHSTGTWALVFLLITLSMTPIRLLTGQVWQIQLRRVLGLFMFFYACLHIITYVWLDFVFIWDELLIDVAKHPRILVGFAAFLLAIPLAATSNSYMIKRLKTNWKRLHQAVYLIAILAVVHFWMLVKKDLTEPIYYAVVLIVLLGIRLYFKYKPLSRAKVTKAM